MYTGFDYHRAGEESRTTQALSVPIDFYYFTILSLLFHCKVLSVTNR
jgi:hypothetical protein